MICIYKIEYFYNLLDLNYEWSNLTPEDEELLMGLSAESFFDYELDNMYICYLISDSVEVSKYFSVLDKYEINYKSYDISELILKSEIDIEHILVDYVDSDNSIKYDFFIEDTNNWILENLDIDTVLDKISKTGINGLNKIEKDFLKNYNKG